MDVVIPYGKEKVRVVVPEPCEILTPKTVATKNEDEIIEKALQNPLGSESFEKFLSQAKKLLIIVNDATRPTPTKKILEYLYSTLANHPDVKFLVATGMHRKPTEEEYHFIFGHLYEDLKTQIFIHDAKKMGDMVFLGESQNGTKIYINRMVPEAGNILVIGSVEPHYFAGYTGGRKSFLPGVASYKTIEMNHKLALSKKATSLALKENPVHEDMVDAMNVLRSLNIFSVQTVLTGDNHIYAVTAGDLVRSFDAAIGYAKEIFCAHLEKKGNIVITVAQHPMDIDLYQSLKALENGQLALEENGIIILVSKCSMGIGEETFLELLGNAGTPARVLDVIRGEYKLGYHKAAKLAQIATWADMWAVTSLDDKIIRRAMLKPYRDIQKAVDDAIQITRLKNKKPRVVIMLSGSLVIPQVKQSI